MLIGHAASVGNNPHHTEGPYPDVYDRENPGHQNWLLWWLEQLEVPFSHLDQWGDAMHGHEVAELDRLITLYRKWQVKNGLTKRQDR